MTQFSLFGAEASSPSLDDLDGVLLAGGRWVRSGDGARLSVVVDASWRGEALAAVFAELGVGGDDPLVPAPIGLGVRTAFHADLVPHAARWTRGANQGLPTGFALTAGGLRLWAVASGRRDGAGYLFTTPADDVLHGAAGAALSRLGVAAVALTARGRPGWRVTSARRLRRLVELLGPAPAGGDDSWPVPA